jgi:alkylation response protein AidB-like acyl-CoA dehydrogenase
VTNGAPHPSAWLDSASAEAIRHYASDAELMRDLHPQQLASIYRNHWLKMYVPRAYGGLALALPEILRLEEALSWCDGSTAWVVTLCSGAGWFVGFIDPRVAQALFTDDKLCVAGSGAVTGVAEMTDDGYVLNGRWNYASGALHATAFTVNCSISKDGCALHTADGSPQVSTFILTRDEVVIEPCWNSMGMIATGSHAFTVENLAVANERCFTIAPACAVLQAPLYQYPFLQLAEATLAVNLSGMAVRFIELAEEVLCDTTSICHAKEVAIQEGRDMRETLHAVRTDFYDKVDQSWHELLSGHRISDEHLLAVSAASHALVCHARDAVNRLYPRCGLKAASMEREINRVWRNIHTAGQHALFSSR